jgi:single-stranded-DNA-specific exonuclease
MPVYDLLQACQEAPLTFGGHQAAAGVHVRAPALQRFRELFNAAVAGLKKLPSAPGARPEVRLHPEDRANDVVTDLGRLEPCGMGNPSPAMAVLGAAVMRAQAVRGGHLQVTLQTPAGDLLHGFGSGMGELAATLPVAMRVDAVGRLRRDTWRGGHAVAMRVEAIEPVSGA